MLHCCTCGNEIAEYEANLCQMDFCINAFCVTCFPPDHLCKDHKREKVYWDWQPRQGYGVFYKPAGVVVKRNRKKVKIAVYETRKKRIEFKHVDPELLSPRTKESVIDFVVIDEEKTR